MDKCSVIGCDRSAGTRGMCKMHVTRWYRHGDPLVKKRRAPTPGATIEQLKERFLTKIEERGECWIWMPGKKRYGDFHVGKHFGRRRIRPAHQASFLLYIGPINGLHVLHTCDNDRCVNPRHLYLGTHQQNMLDRKERKRSWAAPGALNPAARLTEQSVSEIRSLAAGGMAQRRLARQYGVAQSTIGRVVREQCWRPATLPTGVHEIFPEVKS